MSLTFSNFQLTIGGHYPSPEDLRPAFAETEDKYSERDRHYLITKENRNDEYFWLYARHGKSRPHSSTVYNIKSQQEEGNPRSTEQVEPVKQLFVLYCIHSRTLYLSNIKKKAWVENYLNEKLNQNVILKHFYKDIDDIRRQMRTIHQVRFVQERTLWDPRVSFMGVFDKSHDVLGLGVPDRCTITADFNNAPMEERFTDLLKKVAQKKKEEEGEESSLVCTGRDDRNMEVTFDLENYTQKISIEASEDEEGFYDATAVEDALIREVERLR